MGVSMPLSYASKGITMYYYVLSLAAPDVLQILCRRRSGNAARTVGKRKWTGAVSSVYCISRLAGHLVCRIWDTVPDPGSCSSV